LQAEAVQAIVPIALAQAGTGTYAAPEAPVAPPAPLPAPASPAPDPAAMRPDQALMASQLHWPRPDGATLAGTWRALVRGYGARLAERERQMEGGRLPSALLLASQDRDMPRQPDPGVAPSDPWRFAVHAGLLRVVEEEERAQPQAREERRRTRAALRLEVVLEDGTVAAVQVEPAVDGVVVTLCAAGTDGAARLRELQPRLAAAIERAGLRVRAWLYRDVLPDAPAHARVPSAQAADMLDVTVFRALAEMALVLPS
jgi:hypothetical protein